jgi:hypothetical protein
VTVIFSACRPCDLGNIVKVIEQWEGSELGKLGHAANAKAAGLSAVSIVLAALNRKSVRPALIPEKFLVMRAIARALPEHNCNSRAT